MHCTSNSAWTMPPCTAGGLVFGWNALAIMLQEQGFYTKGCGQSGDGAHGLATIFLFVGCLGQLAVLAGAPSCCGWACALCSDAVFRYAALHCSKHCKHFVELQQCIPPSLCPLCFISPQLLCLQ